MANRAAVETMPRTVNTGLGSMFILAALAVLGGDSLRDFAIALLVGLVVGTYSSVFTATPMLTYFQEKWPMSRVKKEKVVRDARGLGASSELSPVISPACRVWTYAALSVLARRVLGCLTPKPHPLARRQAAPMSPGCSPLR